MPKSVLRIVLLAHICFSLGDTSLVQRIQRRDGLHEHLQFQRRQTNGTNSTNCYPVLGIKGHGNTAVHPRLEIRELERNSDQFNVYLLGLQRFQNTSQDDKLSYFRVAGIHGRPSVAWDGVEKHPRGDLGYCRHSSNIFAPWHRPYLALLEERIYLSARDVISEFPDGAFKRKMNGALQAFRIPYWDAAAVPPVGEGSYPWCVQKRTIEVEVPDGGNATTQITIPNPLYSYVFHPLPVDDFRSVPPGSPDQWIEWNCTKRLPTTRNVSADSQNYEIAFHLDWNQANTRQRTYQMLAMQKDYYNISNNAVQSKDPISGAVLDSLESVHDTLHNTVGDGGHMWQTQYSAFDPIFWLLHANTDRMLAIWQELNPNSYVTNHSNTLATFTTPPRSWADENTPLHPFHRTEAGDFWTSATVRNHRIFGYTYPELINVWEDKILIRRINALYGENATSQFSWDRRQEPRPVPGSSSIQASLNSTGCAMTGITVNSFPPTPVTSGAAAASSSCGPYKRLSRRHVQQAQRKDVQYHYFANIRAQKGGSASAYKVFVFVDSPNNADSDSGGTSNWIHDPGFVGFTGFQEAPTHAGQDEPFEANGVVVLTQALEDRILSGGLASLDEETVARYLSDKMSWRISMIDDRVVKPEDAPGFEIEVSWARFKPPTADTFPVVQDGGFKHLMHATSGKAGGVEDN